MLRSSRLAVLGLAFCILAAPTAQASPPEAADVRPAAPTQPKVDSVSTKQANQSAATVTLALHRFETMRPNFQHPGDSVAPDAVRTERWSPRTQTALQNSAFDHAFADVMRQGSFAPESFSTHFLLSLVDYAGADNVRQAVRSLKPGLRAERYRTVLRAINDNASKLAGVVAPSIPSPTSQR